MNDTDKDLEGFLSEAYRLYEAEIQSRCPEDYEVYLPNMSKLMCTYAFLSQIAAEQGGRVEDLKFDKREINGGIVAYFTVIHLSGESLTKFCDLIKEAYSVGFCPMLDDTICLSMTFEDVFRKIR